MNIKRRLLLGMTLVAASAAGAATLTLTDGSAIKGDLEKVHEGVVYFKTGFAGTLEIPQEQVAGLSSDMPVMLRTSEGEVFKGPVMAGENGKVTVASSSGPVSADIGGVASAWKPGDRDPIAVAKEAALEGQLRKWSYQASVDVTGSDGNTENFGSMLAFEAKLEGPDDRLLMYANYSYQETGGVKSQDEQKGGMKYTNFFTEKWGWFVREELERDTFEKIDFRSTTAAGITYKFIEEDRMTLEGSGGISYRYESYSDLRGDDGFAGLDFALDFGWQFADWGKLVTNLTYVPSIDDFGDFLFTHESGVNIPLGTSDAWVLRLGLSHKYNSEPGDGLESLDTTYFTRLILKWD
jgi:putative salt-induced outer membrane protein YdiY